MRNLKLLVSMFLVSGFVAACAGPSTVKTRKVANTTMNVCGTLQSGGSVDWSIITDEGTLPSNDRMGWPSRDQNGKSCGSGVRICACEAIIEEMTFSEGPATFYRCGSDASCN